MSGQTRVAREVGRGEEGLFTRYFGAQAQATSGGDARDPRRPGNN